MFNSDDTLAAIKEEIKKGTLPSTLCLVGADDGMRLDSAKKIAACLMCEAGGCLGCDVCSRVMAGRHGDMTVVSAPEGTSVKVELLRHVRQDAYMSPFEAPCKVIILERANTISIQGQNLLLKILEEPPKNVYFILLCPSEKNLLPTVRSRCTVYSLGEVPEGVLSSRIKAVCPAISEEALDCASAAVSRLENFAVTDKSVAELVSALDFCAEFYESGKFPFEALPSKKEDSRLLGVYLRALCLASLEVATVKKGGAAFGVLKKQALDGAITIISAKAAYNYYELFLSLYERLQMNANFTSIMSVLRASLGR